MFKKLKEKNFDQEVLDSKIPVVVDFYATWCVPCRMLSPLVDELEDKYDGRLKVRRVDIEEEPELVTEYNISTIPTLIFFDKGSEMRRSYGYITPHQLKEFVEITI